MGTRINKQFLLVAATLGVILSVFSAPAQADIVDGEPTASFVVSPAQVMPGESVTVTDTSTGTAGFEVSYEWQVTGGDPNRIHSGNPECLNADCSQARWAYSSPGPHTILLTLRSEKCSGLGGICSEFTQGVTVIDPAEAPAPLLLNGPTTVSLPTVLDVMSPKPHMRFGGCVQEAFRGTKEEYCEPYLLKRVGPDPSGFYHYRWRFVMAQPGPVEIGFSAWNKAVGQAQYQTFDLNVTGNAFSFGDVRTCYWPNLVGETGELKQDKLRIYELAFYSKKDARVTLRLQIRRNGRWVNTRRKRTETFSSRLSSDGQVYSKASRKLMHVRFGPRTKNRRVTYQIKNGRKLLKQGFLSKRNCAVPFRA